jgi:hypothetical protein
MIRFQLRLSKLLNLSTGEPNAMTSNGFARYNVGGVVGLNTWNGGKGWYESNLDAA